VGNNGLTLAERWLKTSSVSSTKRRDASADPPFMFQIINHVPLRYMVYGFTVYGLWFVVHRPGGGVGGRVQAQTLLQDAHPYGKVVEHVVGIVHQKT
jgi:hypothetical protein